jgi:hypothetical protein
MLDTRKSADELEAAGVDPQAAKAHVEVTRKALEDYPSVDRLDKMFADFKLEVHRELSGFKLQITLMIVASLIGILVNLLLTLWKH